MILIHPIAIMMVIRKYPTLLGYIALVFWALAAPFAVKIKSIPVFEALAITFTLSFLFSGVKLTICRQWGQLKQPWFLWLIGFLGIYGNDLLYIAAFKYAPAAHAELINYLWPILVVLFTGCLPKEKLLIRYILAAIIGFAGIYMLIQDSEQNFERQYLFGYFLAFFDALVWAIYTLVARHFSRSPIDMIGIYSGIGAICSLFLHFQLEKTIEPDLHQWLILGIMGMTTQCLAYFFWDFGVKQGNFKLLSILSYGNPILSVVILIILGMANPSLELLFACLLVTLGGLIGVVPWQLVFIRLMQRRAPSR